MGQQQRVLVVDDEEAIRLQLEWQLQAEGFEVVTADDGASALALVISEQPALVVLDITMPRLSGLDVLHTLRGTAATRDLPVIILSGRSADEERIAGLDGGADDYLVKPFSPGELAARVRSLLRRTQRSTSAPQADVLVRGDIRIDEQAREVLVRDACTDLTAKEFDLLIFLARHPRQVFTRAQLLQSVWDNDGWQSEATVTEHIRRLRSKLDPPDGPSCITTVRGVGYRLES